jgi:VIT1/CCC1 family predicted Fe2+/Mn2+ transporter
MALFRNDPVRASRRVLEPDERVAEVLFGLIMVITFTGSLSVAEAGREDVRTMIIGAFGCNLAWGIIDGVLYVMGCLAARGQRLRQLWGLKNAEDAGAAERILAAALPPLVASVIEQSELASIGRRLRALPDPPNLARITAHDLLGALAVFLLVFLSTFPVAVPFVFVHDIPRAMRLSNAIALGMLLATGAVYGRIVGRSALGFGIGMVAIGGLLVTLTIALGG